MQNPLAEAPIGWGQIRIIVCCLVLTAIDGFDMLAIGFAGPGIAAEWKLGPSALGSILAAELLGVAAGSILFGRLADKIGRKPVILLGLILMAVTMGIVAISTSVVQVGLSRLVTGLGIGAVLVGTNALAAEYASLRRRGTVVTFMALGFPVGTTLGGVIASGLLRNGDWREIFLLGFAVTTAMIPIAMLTLRESVDFLIGQRTASGLRRGNAILSELGIGSVIKQDNLLPKSSAGWHGLLAPGMAVPTCLVTLALFAHFMTSFFLLKWIPKIVADSGFHPSQAGGALVWASIGGLIGCIILSAATFRRSPYSLVLGALLISFMGVVAFGFSEGALVRMSSLAFFANFGGNAATIGLFALAASVFPSELRGAGLGVSMGFGRGGAALGPYLGGLLFAQGLSLNVVTAVLATGSLISALAVIALHRARAIAV